MIWKHIFVCLHIFMWFVIQAGHIISIEDANSILERNLDNVKKSSVDKLVNHRHLIEKKNKDKAQISRKAYEEYEKEPLIYAYGKALKGLIMQSLQERFGENINLIFPSQALDQEEFKKFHGKRYTPDVATRSRVYLFIQHVQRRRKHVAF